MGWLLGQGALAQKPRVPLYPKRTLCGNKRQIQRGIAVEWILRSVGLSPSRKNE